jgi:hypothetical protein
MTAKRRTVVRPGRGWRDTICPGDVYDWQVTLKLPLLAKPFIRAKFEGLVLRQLQRGQRRKRTSYLQEVGGFGEGTSPAQARALDSLAENESAVCAKLLRAVAAYAKDFRANDLRDWEARNGRHAADLLVPRGMTPEQVAERIQIRRIAVETRALDGVAYIEINCECAWDREHGFTVVLHRNRVVEVCQQGAGWTDGASRKRRQPKR